MKKYLISASAALVFGSFLVGCHDDDGFSNNVIEQKVETFAENFKKAFGPINPNQDWGFGESSNGARTRGYDSDANNWAQNGWVVPPVVTSTEIETVKAEFAKEHREGNQININFTNFFVQQVFKGVATYTPTKTDGTTEDAITGSNQMDYLTCGPTDEHIYNFNNGDAGTANVNYDYTPVEGVDQNNWKKYRNEKISLMTGASTSRFGYYNSWTDENKQHYEYIILQINGAYYVGFDFCGRKNDGTYVSQDYKYNDWIVKISPATKGGGDTPNPSTPTTGGTVTKTDGTSYTYLVRNVLKHRRIFCEDLGQTTDKRQFKKDYDYNDVVFDAKNVEEYYEYTDVDGVIQSTTTPTYKTEITLLAAGGELTVSVAGENVHSKFNGLSDNVMINTFREGETMNGAQHQENVSPVTFVANYYYDDFIDIPINVKFKNGDVDEALKLFSEKGQAPHKISVPVGTRWAYERTPIDSAYTTFSTWVSQPDNTPWSSGVYKNLYPQMDGVETTDSTDVSSRTETAHTTTGTSYAVNITDHEISVISYTDGEDLINWNGFEIKNGWSRVKKNTVIRVYGDVLNNSNEWSVQMTDASWNNRDLFHGEKNSGNSPEFANPGYVEVTIPSQGVAQLIVSNGLVIWGKDFKVLAVTIDNTNATDEADTPTEPTFTAPTLAADQTQIGQSQSGTDLTSNGITVTSNELANVGENTEITVYGIAQDGASVSATTSDGTALQSVSSARTRAAQQTSYTFKVQSEAVAAKIRADKIIKISGSNFKYYLAAAKVVEHQEEPPVDNTGNDILLTNITSNGKTLYPASLFTNVASGDELHLYYTSWGPWYWQVQVWNGNGQGLNIPNWGGANVNTKASAINETEKYVILGVNDEVAGVLTTNGIYLQFDNMQASKIMLHKGSN